MSTYEHIKPDQTVTVCLEKQVILYVDAKSTVKWEVSNDSGCTFEKICGKHQSSLKFVAELDDDGTLYRATYIDEVGCKVTKVFLIVVCGNGVNHTVYVDINFGDNQTGQVENPLLPFRDIEPALEAILDSDLPRSAEDPWVIRVRPGTYQIWNDFWIPSFVTLLGSGAETTIIEVETFVGYDPDLFVCEGEGISNYVKAEIKNVMLLGKNRAVVKTRGINESEGLLIKQSIIERTDQLATKSDFLMWRAGTPGEKKVNTVVKSEQNTRLEILENSSIKYLVRQGVRYPKDEWLAAVGAGTTTKLTDSRIAILLEKAAKAKAVWATLAYSDEGPKKLFVPTTTEYQLTIRERACVDQLGYIAVGGAFNAYYSNETIDVDIAATAIVKYILGLIAGDFTEPTVVEVSSVDTNFLTNEPGEAFTLSGFGDVDGSANFIDWDLDFIPDPITVADGTSPLPPTPVNLIQADNQADLEVGGQLITQSGVCANTRVIDEDQTLLPSDYIVFADTSVNVIEIDLPANQCDGKMFIIKNTDIGGSNNVTVNGLADGADGLLLPGDSITIAYLAATDTWFIVSDFRKT